MTGAEVNCLYVSHPEVAIDPAIPVPHWSLSDKGRERATAFARKLGGLRGGILLSSDETKAVELAQIICAATRWPCATFAEMGENDRSSTGFVPPELFAALAKRFFDDPEKSIEGWERAIDAQHRIVSAVDTALIGHEAAKLVIFCGHGGVGTLLKCAIGQRPIAAHEDQQHQGTAGGGNYFQFRVQPGKRLDRATLLCDWTPIEDFEGMVW